jgi:hypothetical protein
MKLLVSYLNQQVFSAQAHFQDKKLIAQYMERANGAVDYARLAAVENGDSEEFIAITKLWMEEYREKFWELYNAAP